MSLLIVSIDVGILHLGIVWAKTTTDFKLIQFDGCDLVNLVGITRTVHERLTSPCSLSHTNTLVDRLRHFQLFYHDLLANCHILFIEQQPMQGHTAVEQILFDWYRDRAVLVHPRTMHKHMGFTLDMDYEKRKIGTQNILSLQPCSESFCATYQGISTTGERRVHDISDAACLLLSGLMTVRKKKERENQVSKNKEISAKQLIIAKNNKTHTNDTDLRDFLEQFRHQEN